MRTLYLRNVPGEVIERLERRAERDATSAGAAARLARPSYAAYAVSFVTVAIVWVNYHRLMGGDAVADRTLLELNLLLLLFVSLAPWPTGLLAEHLRTRDQASAAAVTYGLIMTCTSAAFTMIWIWLARHTRLLCPSAP